MDISSKEKKFVLYFMHQKRQPEEVIRRGNQKRQPEEATRRGNQKR